VLVNIAGVAAFGILLGLIFWGIDLLLARIRPSPALSSEE
jgi:preprotein translocase subunit SecE